MADVILYLVDRSRFDRIMAMRVEEITSGMESSEMRGLRPKKDARFHRDFDVDLEGDILEAVDSFDDFDPKSELLTSLIMHHQICFCLWQNGVHLLNGVLGSTAFSICGAFSVQYG